MRSALLVLVVTIPASCWAQTLPSTCVVGQGWYNVSSGSAILSICTGTNVWTTANAASGVPSTMIGFIDSGTCPAGWTEVTALNGKTIIGTVAANGDVGTTGGSDSVTPTFLGDSVVSSATSGGTPAGTNQALTFTGGAWSAPAVSWPAGVPTAANESAHTHSVTSNVTATINQPNFTAVGTKMTTSGSGTATLTSFNGTVIASGNTTVANPAQTVTPTNNAVTSGAGAAHTHTLSWPAGVPTIATYTPAGTINTPTFSGSALATHTHNTTATGTISAVDTRSANVKMIACRKN